MHNKTVFRNGLRVVSERVAGAHTVALGIWVDVGSRDETADVNGTSHFVEHMFFKGTARRSAHQISRQLDSFGGMANAFTSKDTTCLHATVLVDKLPELIDLFADMFHHSRFADDEVERERQVILQEISMVEDIPEDQVHDLFEALFWGEHALARPVLGDPQVVSGMTGKRLHDYVGEMYDPGRIVISCAGKVDHGELCTLLEPLFGEFSGPPGGPGRSAPAAERPLRRRAVTKEIEQVQLMMGVKALEITAPERYALVLLNTILGGNMSSRLFQEIREKRGLAYSITSFIESYIDCGYLGISCGVGPRAVNDTMALINEQLQQVTLEKNLLADEMRHALDYAHGSLYLAAESLDSRMARNARNELYFGRDIPLNEVVDQFSKVRAADIADLAARLFSGPLCIVAMGPLTEIEVVWPS
ncbi:MAG: insulinase family protein [Desulfobulbaceae bacterium]|nr:MAG: insulinase family protein [Desulfobulbaceae bacterium]